MIPPHVFHRFEYTVADVRYLSVRFTYCWAGTLGHCRNGTIDRAVWLPRNTASNALNAAVLKLVQPGRQVPQQEIGLLEHLLSAYVRLFMDSLAGPDPSIAVAVIEEAKRYIQENAQRPVSVIEVADHVSYSPGHLSTLFRNVEHVTTKEYIDLVRLELVKQFLAQTDFNNTEIAEQLGFCDVYSFSHFFKRGARLSPSSYRNAVRKREIPPDDRNFTAPVVKTGWNNSMLTG